MNKSESELWHVCGWFGDFVSQEPPARALSQMLGEHTGISGSWLVHSDQKAAICLSAGVPGRDLGVDGKLSVAVFGEPWWSDPALEAIARETGHAAAVLNGYRRRDGRLFQHLHGPFGLIVLDGERGEALLAIDRVGIHCLNYAVRPGRGIVFATGADLVARHPAVGLRLSPQGLFNYLYYSYRVAAPDSIFTGVKKLLPAQSLRFRGERCEATFYWQMPFRRAGAFDRKALNEGLFESLRAGVKRAVAGGQWDRIGTFLSGGLDSSVITGLVNEISAGRLKAFTIGFDSPRYDERPYAAITAQHFGIDHRIYEVTPADVFEAVPRIAVAYDEPFANSSAVPVYYCARFAKSQGVDRLIAGDGGDELFAGNAHTLRMKIFELYSLLPNLLRSRLIEPAVSMLPQSKWNVLGWKARRYIEQANIPMPERMFEHALERIKRAASVLDPAWLDDIDVDRPIEILREVYERPADAAFEQRIHQLELQTVLADNDLRKVNRMCALAGVEVRYPMLDEAVCNFSAMLPPQLFLEGLKLRAFFKQAMAGFLPPATLKKRKHGFGLPLGPWLEPGSALLNLAYDCLVALKARHIFNASYIDEVIARHRADPEELNADPIWEMTMLELWLSSRDVVAAPSHDILVAKR
ncbi:MAG: asparagine synthetase B family protein [Stellaceae bacterium]